MKILVLLENNIDPNSEVKELLTQAHGLSLYIEWNGKKILFDTGPDCTFARNAEVLGIDLSLVDLVILSHGHNDHSGGLEEFFRLNSTAPVYLHREAPVPHFSKKFTGNIVSIGIDPSTLDTYKGRFQFIEQSQNLLSGLSIHTDIPEGFPRPATNENLYSQKGAEIIPDDFRHEIVLSLDEGEKTVIITGCSHSGILNMVDLVIEEKPQQMIKAILGGFHIFSRGRKSIVPVDYLEKLTEGLSNLNTEIYTGHCTGEANFDQINKKLRNKLHRMNTGLAYEL